MIEGTYKTEDGLELFYRQWDRTAGHRGAIAILHGYAEHSGRYQRLAERFVPLGYSLYACDLRGHGRSPGKRGHIQQFAEYLEDAKGLIHTVTARESGGPLFLLGHSMGGLIAARYAESYPAEIQRLVLSSPFLKVKMPVPAWKLASADLLSIAMPSLAIPSGIPVEWISHDEELVRETRMDPLNHHFATPRWFTETRHAQREALEAAGSITASTSVFYAGADKIADPAVTEAFVGLLGSTNKHSCRYQGYYHEIFNEVGRETVFEDLEDWLASHG